MYPKQEQPFNVIEEIHLVWSSCWLNYSGSVYPYIRFGVWNFCKGINQHYSWQVSLVERIQLLPLTDFPSTLCCSTLKDENVCKLSM